MSRPPLLCEEGNVAQFQFIHILYDRRRCHRLLDCRRSMTAATEALSTSAICSVKISYSRRRTDKTFHIHNLQKNRIGARRFSLRKESDTGWSFVPVSFCYT